MKDPRQILEIIRSLPLFSQTEAALLETWLSAHSPKELEIAAGEEIGRTRALGILLSGRAAVLSADSGRSVILREVASPAVFGAASLFCMGDEPLSRIEAKTACSLLFLSADAVTALMDVDRSFRNAYLAFLAGRVQFLNRKIQCFTAGSAERRLALWLCSEEGNTLTLPTSLTALSDMLNLGRASLYRALDKLEADGMIARNGRSITLLSKDTLLKKYQ